MSLTASKNWLNHFFIECPVFCKAKTGHPVDAWMHECMDVRNSPIMHPCNHAAMQPKKNHVQPNLKNTTLVVQIFAKIFNPKIQPLVYWHLPLIRLS